MLGLVFEGLAADPVTRRSRESSNLDFLYCASWRSESREFGHLGIRIYPEQVVHLEVRFISEITSSRDFGWVMKLELQVFLHRNLQWRLTPHTHECFKRNETLANSCGMMISFLRTHYATIRFPSDPSRNWVVKILPSWLRKSSIPEAESPCRQVSPFLIFSMSQVSFDHNLLLFQQNSVVRLMFGSQSMIMIPFSCARRRKSDVIRKHLFSSHLDFKTCSVSRCKPDWQCYFLTRVSFFFSRRQVPAMICFLENWHSPVIQ